MKTLFTLSLIFVLSNANAQGNWQQVENFGGQNRSSAVAFSIGGYGYVGLGGSNDMAVPDLWQYDPTVNVWTQKADFAGGNRIGAVGFSIEHKGYVGTGDPNLKDFWEYDPATNTWTQKKNFPGKTRRYGCGFSIGGKGYMGLGESTGDFPSQYKDWWEYDPSTNQWTQKGDFKRISKVAVFVIGNKGYVCCGYSSGNIYENQLWSYDPVADLWSQKADFGGGNRRGPTGFAINGKGYVGTGYNYNLDSTYSDLWEYDTTSDAWSQVASLPGPARFLATGFSIGSNGYIGIGDSLISDSLLKDFYEFSSGCETPTNLTTSNIDNSKATLNWSTISGATKYQIRYKAIGNTNWAQTNAIGTSKTIAGLTANTSYMWQVRSVCSTNPTVTSDWSSKQHFTTSLRLSADEEATSAFDVYPNPFSTLAVISFSLAESSHTVIELYDLSGKKISTVLDQDLDAGDHRVELNRNQLGNGIYLVQLRTDDQISTMKVVLE